MSSSEERVDGVGPSPWAIVSVVCREGESNGPPSAGLEEVGRGGGSTAIKDDVDGSRVEAEGGDDDDRMGNGEPSDMGDMGVDAAESLADPPPLPTLSPSSIR